MTEERILDAEAFWKAYGEHLIGSIADPLTMISEIRRLKKMGLELLEEWREESFSVYTTNQRAGIIAEYQKKRQEWIG